MSKPTAADGAQFRAGWVNIDVYCPETSSEAFFRVRVQMDGLDVDNAIADAHLRADFKAKALDDLGVALEAAMSWAEAIIADREKEQDG